MQPPLHHPVEQQQYLFAETEQDIPAASSSQLSSDWAFTAWAQGRAAESCRNEDFSVSWPLVRTAVARVWAAWTKEIPRLPGTRTNTLQMKIKT